MKKIDLHIHTLSTVKDADFTFSIDALLEYISELKLDAIAITNHNTFDIEQFSEINNATDITVFPGIEVDLEKGHILVICSKEDIVQFDEECKNLSKIITDENGYLKFEEFVEVFPNYKDYLLIPHYEKKPRIHDDILKKMEGYINVGEVQNAKKFIVTKKSENSLTPVLFSDIRISEDLLKKTNSEKFPIKMTLLDIDVITIKNLKTTFMDKTKVSISEDANTDDIIISSDGTTGSNKLNVILGKRASGKSYLLNTISKSYDSSSVKYIKQFFISKNSDEEAFEKMIQLNYDKTVDSYLSPLKHIISKIIDVSEINDDRMVGEYLNSLKENAREQLLNNEFSEVKLFTTSKYSVVRNQELFNLISSVVTILDSDKYREIIEGQIDINSLKNLFLKLREISIVEKKDVIIKERTNSIIDIVKSALNSHTSITRVKDINLYDILKNRVITEEFNSLIIKLKQERYLERLSEEFYGFKMLVSKNQFTSTQDLKDTVIKRQISIVDTFNDFYDTNPLQFIKGLKEKGVEESLLYKTLIKVKIDIKDESNQDVSGGQRSEFILLKELVDASDYDILLIDEPESSFDNPFIKAAIISKIKDISQNTTTFVATHNNTLGVLMSPDRILYTENDGDAYRIYSGSLTSKVLKCVDGKEIQNYNTLIEIMEAGEDSYSERGEIYEGIKN